MTINERRELPIMCLSFLNSLVISYTEKYQDIPLDKFIKMNLDPFYEELSSLLKMGPNLVEHFKEIKNHLVSFQKDRSNFKQDHIPYPIRYINPKEFYWAISEFYLGDSENVSRKFLFTELLYMRHLVCSLTLSNTDLTLDGGKTYFSLAVHGYYEKNGNRFGTNGHLFYPDDQHITVYPILNPLYSDDYQSKKIEQIDTAIEKEFEFYDLVKKYLKS